MAEITLKLLDTKRIIPIGKDGFEINVENKNGSMVIAGETNVSMLHLVFTKDFLQNNKDKINTDDKIVVTVVNANNEYTIVTKSYDSADVTESGTWLMDVTITSAMTFVGYTKVFIQWKSANDSIFVWERFDLKVWSTDPNYIPGTSKKYVPADFVEANPSGEPTQDLEKIKINDVIYNIPGFEIPTFTDSTIWTKEFIAKVVKVGYAIYMPNNTMYSVFNADDSNIELQLSNASELVLVSYDISVGQTILQATTSGHNLVETIDGRIPNVTSVVELNDAANKGFVLEQISDVETEIESLGQYAQNTQQELNELKASLYGYVFGEDTANFSKLDISALPSMINNNNVAYNTRLMLDTIKGRSVKWTQLIDASIFISSQTVSGVTFTFNKTNGTITVNGTATEDITLNLTGGVHYSFLPTDIIYFRGCPSGGSADTYSLYWDNAGIRDTGAGIYTKMNKYLVISDTTKIWFQPKIVIKSGVTMTNKVFRPQLFNVSDIYGLGKEPKTIADFNKDYPYNIYPYGKQEILTTKVSGIKIRAGYKNLLDKSKFAATQTINGVTFTNNGDGSYTLNGTASAAINFRFYDVSSQYFSSDMFSSLLLFQGNPAGVYQTNYSQYVVMFSKASREHIIWEQGVGNIARGLFGVGYIDCHITCVAGQTFNNVKWKPELVNLTDTYGEGNEPKTVAQFNQDFPNIDNIPYEEQTISFAEQTLYGINDVQDTLQVVKENNSYKLQKVENIGSVDLGTLTYTAQGTAEKQWLRAIYSNHILEQSSGSVLPDILSTNYITMASNNVTGLFTQYNKTISIVGSGNYIALRDTSITDVATASTTLSGKILYYAKRTPTTTALATLTKNQVTALFAKGYCVEILGNDDNKIIVRPDLSLNMVIKLIGGNTNE